MDKNVSKLQNKIKEIDELVEKFNSQSKQLDGSKEELQKAVKTFEEKREEIIQSVYAEMCVQKQGFEEAQKWYEKTTEEIGDVCYNFEESFGALKNAFDEANFKELCDKLSELARVLEECKSLRDDLSNLKAGIVEEVSKKIEAEMESIRTQQADDRAFMESKFAELFKIFESQTAQETEQ